MLFIDEFIIISSTGNYLLVLHNEKKLTTVCLWCHFPEAMRCYSDSSDWSVLESGAGLVPCQADGEAGQEVVVVHSEVQRPAPVLPQPNLSLRPLVETDSSEAGDAGCKKTDSFSNIVLLSNSFSTNCSTCHYFLPVCILQKCLDNTYECC